MGGYTAEDAEAQVQHAAAGKTQHDATAAGNVGFSRLSTLIPRLAACFFSILALVFLATSKQTKRLGDMKVEANWVDSKSLLTLAVLNAICFGYSLLQTTISFFSFSMWSGRTWYRIKALAWFTFSADQVLTYGLLASASAAAEVAFIAKNGQMNAGWSEVCSTFNSFCNRVGASLVLSFLTVITLIISSLMAGFNAVSTLLSMKA